MIGDRGKQAGRSRWSVWLGLLLVVLLLGHDTLMAGETEAAPHSAPEMAPHAAPAHEPPDVQASLSMVPLGSEHPEQCGVGGTALLRGSDELAHCAQAIPLDDWCFAGAASPLGLRAMLVWVEPNWPPGTRRALWQVYRI